jgi:hypothetical protein
MAATSVILDIRANTSRALNEFKRFSSQLDNKFLISGLKLDVVRSALGQINREFQKAIGEQGLATGQSMRQAENQAAAILGTFKGVGLESSIAITEQFSQAFNRIAVEAGGTAKDVQKALSATPFISTNLSEDLRNQLAEGIQKFQIQATRGGFGDDYSRIIQRYLAGQVTARQLVETGDPLQSKIGAALSKASGTDGATLNAEARSKAVLRIQEQGGNIERLLTTAEERADWGISVIQKLNASLFNPREGLFGSLREITMSIGDKTTIFRETRALIESVFGRQGFFVGFFAQITKIFGIEDPLKVVIKGIRWLTTQFERLTRFLESPQVQNAVKIARETINKVVDFFRSIGDALGLGGDAEGLSWNPEKTKESIQGLGESIRAFIGKISEQIKTGDINKAVQDVISIITVLIEEVTRTLGKVIREGIDLVFSERGREIVIGLVGIVNKGLTGFFTEIFGEGAGGIFAALGTAGIVAAFGKKITLGVVAFGAGLIAALPGGQMLIRLVGNKLKAAVDALGTGLSNLIRGSLASASNRRFPGDQFNSRRVPTPTRGAENLFQKKVLAFLNSITRCVCGPGGARTNLPREVQRRQAYTAPIGPLPEGSREPWARGAFGNEPRLESRSRSYYDPPPLPSSPRPRPGRLQQFGRGAAIAGGVALGAGALGLASEQGSGALDGAATGAMAGMLFGPKGAIAGAILGGIAGWIGDLRNSENQVSAVLGPLTEAFDAIKETLSPTFEALWGSIESIIFSVGNLLNIFGTFSETADGTEKTILGLKIILTPVVAAFQLIEQTARGVHLVFLLLEGATLTLRNAFSWVGRLFGGGSEKGREELNEANKNLEARLKKNIDGYGEQFKRDSEGWYDRGGNKRGGGRRETGGPVQRNQTYLVGERGPELFTPPNNGNIVPNLALTAPLSNAIDSSTFQIQRFFSVVIPSVWSSKTQLLPEWVSVSTGTIFKIFTQTIPNIWNSYSSNFNSTITNSLKNFAQGIGSGLSRSLNDVDLGREILRSLQANIEALSRRAVGGPVGRGETYLVGERGPELFTPGRDGSIMSNNSLLGALNRPSQEPASISANFTVAINVTGGLGTDNVEALRAPILAIVEQAWQEASSGTIKRGAIA